MHGMFVAIAAVVIVIIARSLIIVNIGGFTTTTTRRRGGGSVGIMRMCLILVTNGWIVRIEMFDNGRNGRITVGDTIDEDHPLSCLLLL